MSSFFLKSFDKKKGNRPIKSIPFVYFIKLLLLYIKELTMFSRRNGYCSGCERCCSDLYVSDSVIIIYFLFREYKYTKLKF